MKGRRGGGPVVADGWPASWRPAYAPSAKPRPLRPVRARVSVGNTDCPPALRPGVASNNSLRSLRSLHSITIDGPDNEARASTRRRQAKPLPAPLADCPHRPERPRLCGNRVGPSFEVSWSQRRGTLDSERKIGRRPCARWGVCHAVGSQLDRMVRQHSAAAQLAAV